MAVACGFVRGSGFAIGRGYRRLMIRRDDPCSRSRDVRALTFRGWEPFTAAGRRVAVLFVEFCGDAPPDEDD
jgi:hypothetical protein